MNLSDFDFTLPDDLIAQYPIPDRHSSRLMVLNRENDAIAHRHFYELPNLLMPGDILVINDTKVRPARLHATRRTGGKVEIFLVNPLSDGQWEVMLKPASKIQLGETLSISETLSATLVRNGVVQLHGHDVIEREIEKAGLIPLPPYISASKSADESRKLAHDYQTVYAKKPGAIAAPTAGRHFSPELLSQLQQMGVEILSITLHVGPGTFLPIQTDSIATHRMHAEWYDVSTHVSDTLTQHKGKRRIIAVGTTVARTLETIFDGKTYCAQTGTTDIFLYPGKPIRSFDGLITNFHLPKSTLILLVSAFAGTEKIRRAYDIAIRERYRFYSFGDAMLIL